MGTFYYVRYDVRCMRFVSVCIVVCVENIAHTDKEGYMGCMHNCYP